MKTYTNTEDIIQCIDLESACAYVEKKKPRNTK